MAGKTSEDTSSTHRAQGLSTLLEVSRNLAATLDMPHILQASVDGVANLVGLSTAAIYLIEGDQLSLQATTPPLPPDLPDELRLASLADHPHISRAVAQGEPVQVHDSREAVLTPAERFIVEQRNLRTLLFIPLIVDSKAIGVFIVGSIEKPSVVSEAEIDLSRTLANLAALTLRNSQLFREGQDHAAQLEQTLAERTKAEKERENLQSQLLQAQKMESVGRLAGGVAHDFNNMLSVILGYTDLALTKVDTRQELHSDLMQINDAAIRSANLARQLLAFARRQTALPRILELNDVVGNMLKILRRLIGEDIDLSWLPGSDLGQVRMDPAQVDQIMANLCVNARDAISGVGKIAIETSNEIIDSAYCGDHPGCLPGNYVMIAVSDNGVGMNQETIAKIFEPYYSTKGIGEGTGLGLSTVYGIVNQNRGFINVYSEPGIGTTFKIYLRMHEANDEESRVDGAIDGVDPGGRETILFVEDEAMILNLGRKMLESLGYQVLTAIGPGDALTLAKEHSGTIDLLVTDVVMPEMNGRELSERLENVFPGLKTLYVSGYTASIVANQGVLLEGVMLLSKPFSRNDLATKVREALAMKGSG